MPEQRESRPVGWGGGLDRHLAALAERQHGVVTEAQAREAGGNDAAIRHRVERGRLTPVHIGVFRLAGAVPMARSELLAAVLAAGPSARASHRSAAALHGIPGFSLLPAEITVARAETPDLRGAFVHQSRVLPPEHRVTVDGIACGSVARVLFELCASVHPFRAERALDTCLARRIVTIPECWSALLRLARRGRPGGRVFRELLLARDLGYVPPASELEALVLDVIRCSGLPEPERQVDLGDELGWIGRVDFLFRGADVVVEADGRAFHDSLLDRTADAARDARLRAAGYEVVRVDWDTVTRRPDTFVHALREALHRAG